MERFDMENRTPKRMTEVDPLTLNDWKNAAEALSRALAATHSLLVKTQASGRSQELGHVEPEWLRSWVKLESFSERIASALTVLGCCCYERESPQNGDEISVAAWSLFDYLKRRARSLASPSDESLRERQIAQALEWIRRQPPNENGDIVISTRDLLSHRVAGVKTADETRRLFRELERRGFGKTRSGERRGSLAFVI